MDPLLSRLDAQHTVGVAEAVAVLGLQVLGLDDDHVQDHDRGLENKVSMFGDVQNCDFQNYCKIIYSIKYLVSPASETNSFEKL